MFEYIIRNYIVLTTSQYPLMGTSLEGQTQGLLVSCLPFVAYLNVNVI